MLANERLTQIEQLYASRVARIVVIELDDEFLRLVLYWADGANLRVTEQWSANRLERYGYYWLTAQNELKMGWDNAPHHTRLTGFPHHKHVGRQTNIQDSQETTLEQVMAFILQG